MTVVHGGFGRSRAASNSDTNTTDTRPKVHVWVNIGYMQDIEGGEPVFVSLPTGIALDTMKPVSTKGSNQEFVDFQVARNDMLQQFHEIAEQLQPGEDTIFQAEGGLAIQIRRVQEEKPEAVLTEANRFARTLFQKTA